jgi:alkylated DNA repair dioxygenase AlkB
MSFRPGRLSGGGEELQPMPVLPEGFAYHAAFLTPAEQAGLLAELRHLVYSHDRHRGKRLRRAYAQFGRAYVTSARRLDPAPPLPGFLAELAGKGLAFCPAGTAFNSCIVTVYPPRAGIDWHTDAPGYGECVLAVSLGCPARLLLRPCGAREAACELTVDPGSVYVMYRPARWEYQHKIAPVGGERYSLTFRTVGG